VRDIPEDLESNLAGSYSIARVVGHGGMATGIGAALVAGGVGARALLQKFRRRRQRILSRLLDRLSGLIVDQEGRVPAKARDRFDGT